MKANGISLHNSTYIIAKDSTGIEKSFEVARDHGWIDMAYCIPFVRGSNIWCECIAFLLFGMKTDTLHIDFETPLINPVNGCEILRYAAVKKKDQQNVLVHLKIVIIKRQSKEKDHCVKVFFFNDISKNTIPNAHNQKNSFYFI